MARRRGHEDDSRAVLQSGRLNRYVARAGVCSRRSADRLIDEGKVKVNGHVVSEYWHAVSASDTVEVNGRVISPRPFGYLLLNKPAGIITSASDERGRRTVMDLVDGAPTSAMFPVGRLDKDTTGVLLLTSDGDLAHRLMHPSYEVAKRYVVRTRSPVSERDLSRLRSGVELEDGPAAADMALLVRPEDPHRVALEIHTGRNRQVRRMFEALGHEVAGLDRAAYAGLTARGVRRGRWRRLTDAEVRRIRRLVRLR